MLEKRKTKEWWVSWRGGGGCGFKLTDTLNGFWRNDLSQHLFSRSAGVILHGAMRVVIFQQELTDQWVGRLNYVRLS